MDSKEKALAKNAYKGILPSKIYYRVETNEAIKAEDFRFNQNRIVGIYALVGVGQIHVDSNVEEL